MWVSSKLLQMQRLLYIVSKEMENNLGQGTGRKLETDGCVLFGGTIISWHLPAQQKQRTPICKLQFKELSIFKIKV
jgi:hypothetical protein